MNPFWKEYIWTIAKRSVKKIWKKLWYRRRISGTIPLGLFLFLRMATVSECVETSEVKQIKIISNHRRSLHKEWNPLSLYPSFSGTECQISINYATPPPQPPPWCLAPIG